MIAARLALGPFDTGDELAQLAAAAPGVGGIVSFVGLVRGDGDRVATLSLEHHPVLTQRSLDDIARQAIERFEIAAAHIVHRAGSLMPGEPIVFAGAAARHRRDAFLATDFMMDRLKTEAVFWKRETGAGGARWVEPRDEDTADAARWDKHAEGNMRTPYERN